MQDTSQPFIRWLTDEEILIADESGLSRDVLPRYFKHSNVGSFVLQLNFYGFFKIAEVTDLPENKSLKKYSGWVFKHQEGESILQRTHFHRLALDLAGRQFAHGVTRDAARHGNIG